MLLVDEVDDREFLTGLFNAMYKELPTTKTQKEEIGRFLFVWKWIGAEKFFKTVSLHNLQKQAMLDGRRCGYV